MFLPDLGVALARIRDVLGPEGRFAAAVWGSAERVPLIAVPMQAVACELELPPPAPGTPGPLALADADANRALPYRAARMTIAPACSRLNRSVLTTRS